MLRLEPHVPRFTHFRRRSLWLVAFAACGYPKAGPPPPALSPAGVAAAQTRFPSATAGSLEAGRQSFLAHCKACHDLPSLAAYSDDDWKRILPKMARNAKLSPADGDTILTFVLAARAQPPSAPTTNPASAPPATSHVALTR